ncbi:hypothetical protein, partial [Pseudomonas sp. GM21]|uniref:hypothetical protein n=1 Tax=Pseudomonas sp. GM21 TaxID=1144325 RepID=UPI001EE6633B
ATQPNAGFASCYGSRYGLTDRHYALCGHFSHISINYSIPAATPRNIAQFIEALSLNRSMELLLFDEYSYRATTT